MLFFYLAAPVAIVVRAFTTEEIGREPRDYCRARHECYRERCSNGDAGVLRRAADFVLQKVFYVPTCDYCLSFWISLAVVWIAEYTMFFDDWRGVALAVFVVMGVANVYLAIFTQLRVDAKKERAVAEAIEKQNH